MSMRGTNTRFKIAVTDTDGYYLFDGTDDYINIPNLLDIYTDLDSVTIKGYVNITSFASKNPILRINGDDAINNSYLIFGISNDTTLYISDDDGFGAGGTATFTTDTLSTDTWYYIELKYNADKSMASVKIDSIEMSKTTDSLGYDGIKGTSNNRIGTDNVDYFNGKMKEIKIYENSDIFAYYRMQEDSSGASSPYTDYTSDSSNKDHDATPVNITPATFFNSLGSVTTMFINTSQRTTYDKDSKDVSYTVYDQYKGKYIRKLGTRYTHKYTLFDFTPEQLTQLKLWNTKIATFTQFYDSTNELDVYLDIHYNPYSNNPKSCISIILTEIEVNTNPDIVCKSCATTGYYLFDGYTGNDYINSPISSTDTGTTFSIAFTFKNMETGGTYKNLFTPQNSSGYRSSWYIFAGASSSQFYFKNDGTTVSSSNYAIPSDTDWHTFIITVDLTSQKVDMYIDGVSVLSSTGVIPTTNNAFDTINLFNKDNNNIGAGIVKEIKNIMIFRDLLTSDDVSYYDLGCFDKMSLSPTNPSECLIYFKCNEPVIDLGTSPYTNKTIDYSNNNNHGTPVNITPATFCNEGTDPSDNNIYSIEDNIMPVSMYPKMIYGSDSYSFDSEDMKVTTLEDVNFSNMIDYDLVSGTGKLHRSYIKDANNEPVIQTKFKYRKYNVELTDYEDLRIYDRQLISFYPFLSSADNFTANCSIFFPVLNGNILSNYAEIEIDCIGNIK